MSDAAYVDQAVQWSRDLTRMRTRGPGDIPNAMRSIERDYGIDYWTQWQLRYARDRFKDIGISIYARLHAAYVAECDRQARKFQHEREIARKLAGPAHAAVASRAAVVDDAQAAPGLQPHVQAQSPAVPPTAAPPAVLSEDDLLEIPDFLRRR